MEALDCGVAASPTIYITGKHENVSLQQITTIYSRQPDCKEAMATLWLAHCNNHMVLYMVYQAGCHCRILCHIKGFAALKACVTTNTVNKNTPSKIATKAFTLWKTTKIRRRAFQSVHTLVNKLQTNKHIWLHEQTHNQRGTCCYWSTTLPLCLILQDLPINKFNCLWGKRLPKTTQTDNLSGTT